MYYIVAWLFEVIPWWLAALFVLGLHTYARRFSRETGKHLIYGAGDATLLAVCTFFLLVMFFAIAGDPFISETTPIDFWSLGFWASLIGTVTMSVRAAGNDGERLWASLAAKAAVLLLLPLTILPILLAIFGTKRDRRFRDGTKDNSQTAMIGLTATSMVWLVGSLMGPILVAERPAMTTVLPPAPPEEIGDVRIHIARDGVILGDFDRSEIQAGLASGRFRPTDDAWVEYAPDWVKLPKISTT